MQKDQKNSRITRKEIIRRRKKISRITRAYKENGRGSRKFKDNKEKEKGEWKKISRIIRKEGDNKEDSKEGEWKKNSRIPRRRNRMIKD